MGTIRWINFLKRRWKNECAVAWETEDQFFGKNLQITYKSMISYMYYTSKVVLENVNIKSYRVVNWFNVFRSSRNGIIGNKQFFTIFFPIIYCC